MLDKYFYLDYNNNDLEINKGGSTHGFRTRKTNDFK